MAGKTFYLIANPNAGGGRLKQVADEVVDWFQENGCQIECRFSERPRHILELAETAVRSGEKTILALGGDGTAFEAVNGIARAGFEGVRLGILPAGTGNDFMRHFEITSWKQAAEWALLGKSQAIDVARLTTPNEKNPIYFLNIAGFGLIAEICRLRHSRFHFMGKFAYQAAFFNVLFSMESYPVRFRIDGSVEQIQPTPMFAVCNTCYTGHNLKLSPRSVANDGWFEYFYTDGLSGWETLKLFLSLPSGKHLDHPKIHWGTASAIDIDLQGIDCAMLDGEVIDNAPTRIEILPSALNLFM